jgi:hypothetical protein
MVVLDYCQDLSVVVNIGLCEARTIAKTIARTIVRTIRGPAQHTLPRGMRWQEPSRGELRTITLQGAFRVNIQT